MDNKQRQHLLAYLGYYKMNVDGKWASGSREACKAFQRDRNLTVDGYGGQETDMALKHAVYNDLEKPEPVVDVPDIIVGNSYTAIQQIIRNRLDRVNQFMWENWLPQNLNQLFSHGCPPNPGHYYLPSNQRKSIH